MNSTQAALPKAMSKLLFFLSICLMGFSAAAKEEMPSWAINPPPNSTSELFGVGSGATREQAINRALTTIAGNLSTAVVSEIRQTTELSNGLENNNFIEDMRAEVNKTQFNNYHVVSSTQLKSEIWVLVKVDRQQMANNLQNKIQQLNSELDFRFNDFAKATALEQSQLSPNLQESLNQLKTSAATLAAVQPSFNQSQIMAYALKRETQLRHIKNNMVVIIESDQNMDLFARKIETLLTQRDVKVISSGDRAGKSVIIIKSNVKNMNIQDVYVARVELKVDALDESGKTLKSYMKTLNGASPTSYDAALSQANSKLFDEFTNDNVIGTFGF